MSAVFAVQLILKLVSALLNKYRALSSHFDAVVCTHMFIFIFIAGGCNLLTCYSTNASIT